MTEHREGMAGIGRIEGEGGAPAQQRGPHEHGQAERGASATSERLADSPIPHMTKELPFPLATQITLLAFIICALFLIVRVAPPTPTQPSSVATSTQVSASAASTESAATTSSRSEGAVASSSAPTQSPVEPVAPAENATPAANPNEVRRIEHPYPTAPLKFETVNAMARSALVNIFCFSNNGLMRPISGSGVIIDPQGIILTNAHVAQYVLLAESGRVNLQCQVRAGSPAVAKWTAHALYIPPVWISEHAQDLTEERPFGTGKHDYGLLYAGVSLDGMLRPSPFPSLTPDTREAIGFVDDTVLAASYPAEFLGAITSNFNMYHVTSLTQIDELFTLGSKTVDVISIGSVIGAQSGSSGGAIVNAWGRLIGIVTTTSDGSTTGERRLRGITLSYIDRDITAQSGSSLSQMFAVEPSAQAAKFWADTAPALVEKLLAQIK